MKRIEQNRIAIISKPTDIKLLLAVLGKLRFGHFLVIFFFSFMQFLGKSDQNNSLGEILDSPYQQPLK